MPIIERRRTTTTTNRVMGNDDEQKEQHKEKNNDDTTTTSSSVVVLNWRNAKDDDENDYENHHIPRSSLSRQRRRRSSTKSKGISPQKFHHRHHHLLLNEEVVQMDPNHHSNHSSKRDSCTIDIIRKVIQPHYTKYCMNQYQKEIGYRRAVYKQITVCVTYPLQLNALQHYQTLLYQYHHHSNHTNNSNYYYGIVTPTTTNSTNKTTTGISSSSSCARTNIIKPDLSDGILPIGDHLSGMSSSGYSCDDDNPESKQPCHRRDRMVQLQEQHQQQQQQQGPVQNSSLPNSLTCDKNNSSPRKNTLKQQYYQEFMKEQELLTTTLLLKQQKEKKMNATTSTDSSGSYITSNTLSYYPTDPNHFSNVQNLYQNENTNDHNENDTSSLKGNALSTELLLYEQELKELYHRSTINVSNMMWCMEPKCFGYETSTKGVRKYITAHVGRFMDWYWRKCQLRDRHAYEIITEKTPCRLYLDIEYSKLYNNNNNKQNHNMDGLGSSSTHNNEYYETKLLQELYEELAMEIQEQFGSSTTATTKKEDKVSRGTGNGGDDHAANDQHKEEEEVEKGIRQQTLCGPLQRCHIVDLDSSTDTKFSRHWIVHIPIRKTPSTSSVVVLNPEEILEEYPSSSNDDKKRSTTNHVTNEFLFPNAQAAGIFMTNFVGRLAEQQATGILQSRRPILNQYLFVKTGKKKNKKNTNNTNNNSYSKNHNCSKKEDQDDHMNHEVDDDDDDETTCFIDLSVYSRNRLFRLLGSTKFGKPASAALRIAETNEYPFPNGFNNTFFYLPSMMKQQQQQQQQQNSSDGSQQQQDNTNVDHNNEEFPDELDLKIKKMNARMDWSKHATALANTFIIPLNVWKLDYPLLPVVVPKNNYNNKQNGGGGNSSTSCSGMFSSSQQSFIQINQHNSANTNNNIHGYGNTTSPYPMLDEFVIKNLASRHGIPGSIHSWSIVYRDHDDHDNNNNSTSNNNHSDNHRRRTPVLITYQMIRNRWCECIQRQHKSNNIMWNIELTTSTSGTDQYDYYQTCWDRDCRQQNYMGTQRRPLPLDVSEQLKDMLFEEQLASFHFSTTCNDHDNHTNEKTTTFLPTNQFQKGTGTDSIVAPVVVEHCGKKDEDHVNGMKKINEWTNSSSTSNSDFDDDLEDALASLNLDDILLMNDGGSNNNHHTTTTTNNNNNCIMTEAAELASDSVTTTTNTSIGVTTVLVPKTDDQPKVEYIQSVSLSVKNMASSEDESDDDDDDDEDLLRLARRLEKKKTER